MTPLVHSLHVCAVSMILASAAWGNSAEIKWQHEYLPAIKQAKQAGKMLLVEFVDEAIGANKWIDDAISSGAAKDEDLSRFVVARIPTDASIPIDSKQLRLLDHGAFAALSNRTGLAIIDVRDAESAYYHKVVSIIPFSNTYPFHKRHFAVLLNLPDGSLTQRTMIYAVRTHPEFPKSADGRLHTLLADEANKHSTHQARIGLQGHHNWDSRFHQINSKLANGMTAQEVCAESWPGQDLFDSAIECVHSWRQSSGHWNAVRSHQTYFGYDMKRGRNGIWYATGIFARYR